MKSIKDIPVRVEVAEHTSDHVLSPAELQEQLEAARKGRAKVDSKYVGLGDGLNHLFEYKYNYAQFLDSMSYILKEASKRSVPPGPNPNTDKRLENGGTM